MSNRSNKHRASRSKRRRIDQGKGSTPPEIILSPEVQAAREKYFQFGALMVLLAFGAYYAKVLFGFNAIPNPDWPMFIQVAKELLSFDVPASFKRVPSLGLMQVFIANFVGGDQPILTAGWILNAMMGVLCIVLFWRIGRQLIGDAAIWISILIVLTPHVVRLQTHPIVEITMIAFSALTFLLMFRNSNWCYVAAMVATMLRYECAALIGVCFLWDMVHRKTKKERLLALLWSVLAFLPMAAWLIAMKLTWKPGTRHYIGHFTSDRHLGMEYVRYLWDTSFRNMLQIPAIFGKITSQGQADSIRASIGAIYGFSKAVAGISFVAGVIYGVVKRQWKYLALLLFFVIYVGIHMIRHKTHHRYCVPVVWLSILLCAYGLMCIWRTINFRKWIPKIVVVFLQAVVFVWAVVWLVKLLAFLPDTKIVCPKGIYLPYVSMAAVIAILILNVIFFRTKHLGRNLVISALMCLMITSNHFLTARLIEKGSYGIEFKHLLDWYRENSEPGEKLASSWAHILKYIDIDKKDQFVRIHTLKSEDLEGFARNCRKRGVKYVEWNNRGSGTLKWHPCQLPLSKGNSVGSFELVKRIQIGEKRRMFIYRVRDKSETGPAQ